MPRISEFYGIVMYGRFEPASGVHIERRTVKERTTAHA